MREEKRITQDDIDRSSVTLGNLLGLKPRVWLPGLLALILALFLAAILIVPGIRRNGTIVNVVSLPRGSAVYLDDAYLGSTPGSFFVPRGAHSLTVSRSGFTSSRQDIAVKGRVFGTLFFPRRLSIPVSLSAGDPEAVTRAAFSDFAAFGLSGAPSAIYQIPLVLSDSLLALAESGAPAFSRSQVVPFIRAAFAAAGSEQSARDALRSAFLAAAGGAPSPLGVVAGIEALGSAFSGKPSAARWLAAFSPAKTKTALNSSPAWKSLATRADSLVAPGGGLASGPSGSATAGTRAFRKIAASGIVAAGESPLGTALPYQESVPPFAIAETETTRNDWAIFLKATPEWRPENRAALIAAGKADESYLANWNDTSLAGNLPVTGVSWNAASAYCQWLSSMAPSGYAVVLPSEAMWETAFKSGASDWKTSVLRIAGRSGPMPVGSAGKDRFGIADLAGNVWEWCSDSFFPFPALAPASGGWTGPERSVRGASWANAPDVVSPASRGGFETSFSSPFLGFRPALVLK